MDERHKTTMKASIVFGDSTILRILFALDTHQELSFSQLRDLLAINPASLTKKLRVLCDVGVVSSDRTHDNLRVFYSISRHQKELRKMLDSLARLGDVL